MPPRCIVLRAPGTNCDGESVFAFERAGAKTELIHVNRLLEQPKLLDGFQILCLPGGFSYGDDIASGRILANQIYHHLGEQMRAFRDAGKLVLGICNGFQVMVKCGLLLEDDPVHGPPVTLDWNRSGKFEDRWVSMNTTSPRCVFLRGIESMYVPVAHGEGRFVARSLSILQDLADREQIALRYTASPGEQNWTFSVSTDPQVAYPANPNGSASDVAGVCDATGLALGLMPHPERHIDRTHHPRWTRGEGRDPGDGLRLFQNAVEYFG
ncbi:MAG: phosphoribosylformylglycinamidine synthase subunit PurQ [Pirellulales bacterium]